MELQYTLQRIPLDHKVLDLFVQFADLCLQLTLLRLSTEHSNLWPSLSLAELFHWLNWFCCLWSEAVAWCTERASLGSLALNVRLFALIDTFQP